MTTNTTVPHVTTKPTASEPATVRALKVADGIPLLSVKGAAGCFRNLSARARPALPWVSRASRQARILHDRDNVQS